MKYQIMGCNPEEWDQLKSKNNSPVYIAIGNNFFKSKVFLLPPLYWS